MSVGISVRDVLAVSSLAKDICSCLKDIGGARTEYQDLERELQCLQKALTHLDRLQSKKPSPTIDSIRFAALSCRRPLEEFLRKIRRYESSLGPGCAKNSLRGQVDKIRFRFGQSDEIHKLQNYLDVHLGTINILLAEHGLQTMMLASEEAESERLQIHQRLDDTQQILRQVQDNTSAQTAAYFGTMSILNKVHSIVSGETQSPWTFMKEIVVKACVCTQQIYSVVLDIKTSLASKPDVRWSFFQDPLICEDALGRKFPVPSEYDFAMLNAIIRQRFQAGPGSAEVTWGDFEITEATDRSTTLSESSFLRPGSSLIMAILVEKSLLLTDEDCPMPRCYSNVSRKIAGGGRVCCGCNVWFAVSTKKRKANELREASSLPQTQDVIANGDEPTQSTTRKRQKVTHRHESVRAYKNVTVVYDTHDVSDLEEDDSGLPEWGDYNSNMDANIFLGEYTLSMQPSAQSQERILDVYMNSDSPGRADYNASLEVADIISSESYEEQIFWATAAYKAILPWTDEDDTGVLRLWRSSYHDWLRKDLLPKGHV